MLSTAYEQANALHLVLTLPGLCYIVVYAVIIFQNITKQKVCAVLEGKIRRYDQRTTMASSAR
jgi:hypothetical protein